MHAYFQPLQAAFSEHANPAFALQMKQYMKNHFEFWGIKQAPRRTLFKAFLQEHGLPAWEMLTELIQELYVQPEREYHYCAIELMIKFKKKWTADELELIEWMLVNRSWWDSVDYISADVVGPFFQRFPTLMHNTCQAWVKSDNLWLRRTAIIFQRKYKSKTDQELLFQTIEACAHEKEFFIVKGIGWALREHAKRFPEQVLEFVHAVPLQPLSKREALKHLSK
ncbi:MAG: DNA alkylation repair protein [Flammeovirgaceae bacterium]